jgi:glucose uptake protein
MGSMGAEGMGRSFLDDLKQASGSALISAFLGGIIFNLANILLVAAIDVAGLAVAFPVGIGIALVLGVVVNYVQDPKGNPLLLALGVLGVTVAIIVDAVAYRRLPAQGKKSSGLGIGLSVVAGLSMGFFYRFVVAAMAKDFDKVVDGNVLLEAGKLSPYTAVVIFSVGLLVSNFLWNSIVMVKPFVGEPVPFGDYFRKGSARLHLIGILGGIIWSVGMSFSIVASGPAGPAISYGLGQGATMVAAFWGVFIWKEFKEAPAGTGKLLSVMFASYLVGLVLIIAARLV